MNLAHSGMSTIVAGERLDAARRALIALAAMLPEDGWQGPCAEGLNPPRWEFGHVAWFQELWCLRRRPGRDPLASPLLEPLHPARLPWADWLYDSSRIPHAARWQAPLPTVAATRDYAAVILAAVLERLAAGWPEDDPDLPYFVELSLYHETMHTEAWWMMWQRRGLPAPPHPAFPALAASGALSVPAGPVVLGAGTRPGFAFDNERLGEKRELAAFSIDSRPVTCGEFAEFVAAAGYREPRWWSVDGWRWRMAAAVEQPAYWRRQGDGWQCRCFTAWQGLPRDEAMRHVSAFEAEAYAAWRGRRLPEAAQWQRAAGEAGFQWGGVWEWTATPFLPYAGFAPDPYMDYSQPWFGSHRELRGAGSVFTDRALARPDFRNFYLPHRQDVFAGFRTVAAE